MDSALTVSSPLVDSERVLGLLLGLHACHLARSSSLSPEEEEMDKWLSSDFFSGGLEQTSITPVEDNRQVTRLLASCRSQFLFCMVSWLVVGRHVAFLKVYK